MKKIFIISALVLLGLQGYAGQEKMIERYNRLTGQWAAYPAVSVQWVQQVHQDSLLIADQLQNSIPARWTLQTSDHAGDTVVVTALVVVPAKILTYTNKGYTMLLADTSEITGWRGMFVRASSDSTTHIADGFMAPEAGDIIEMTGVISDFPTVNMNSATQFQPIPGIAINIVGTKQLPTPIKANVSDFYTGIFSGGKVWYSRGEQYEGAIVELTNLVIDAKVNANRGTFSMVDENNDQIATYDASMFFTLKYTSTDHPYPDPVWSVIYNSASFINSKVDTIRGFLTVESGQNSARGYRICPIYYGDIVFGKVLPTVTTHRRYPIVVPSDSTVRITAKAYTLSPERVIASVKLKYSVGGAAFDSTLMTYSAIDSTYSTALPQLPENTFVRYFIEATDDDTPPQMTTYASSAFGGASSDTSKGFFFYRVTDGPLTIQDVQYTPFTNGRTPYLGAVVSLSGIVTADTAHLDLTQPSGGTSTWYMQSGNAPWSGIWFTGSDTTMKSLMNGDSITVTGSVAEDFDVTKLQYVTSLTVHSQGNPVPAPVELNTTVFGANVGNGDPVAESYEGMLVRLTNVTINNIYPTFADPTEYEVNDGSGPLLVQQSRMNDFSNIPGDTISGKTVLKLGDHISSLTGVIYYSFNRYKFVPRNNADFGTVSGVRLDEGDMIPSGFSLEQNYPNPFNPSTNFRFSIANSGLAVLKIYDILGREVATLVNEELNPGSYNLHWDATGLSSGVYLYRLTVNNGEEHSMKKLLLVR